MPLNFISEKKVTFLSPGKTRIPTFSSTTHKYVSTSKNILFYFSCFSRQVLFCALNIPLQTPIFLSSNSSSLLILKDMNTLKMNNFKKQQITVSKLIVKWDANVTVTHFITIHFLVNSLLSGCFFSPITETAVAGVKRSLGKWYQIGSWKTQVYVKESLFQK